MLRFFELSSSSAASWTNRPGFAREVARVAREGSALPELRSFATEIAGDRLPRKRENRYRRFGGLAELSRREKQPEREAAESHGLNATRWKLMDLVSEILAELRSLRAEHDATRTEIAALRVLINSPQPRPTLSLEEAIIHVGVKSASGLYTWCRKWGVKSCGHGTYSRAALNRGLERQSTSRPRPRKVYTRRTNVPGEPTSIEAVA